MCAAAAAAAAVAAAAAAAATRGSGGNTWQRPGFCLIRQNRPPVATRALPKSASSGSQMPFLTSSGTFAHCQPIWTKSQHTLYLRKAKIDLQRQQKKCHRRSILARVFAIGGRFWLFDATGGRFWQGSGHRTRAIKGRFCLMGMSSLKIRASSRICPQPTRRTSLPAPSLRQAVEIL